jgi:hypothetical protein
LQDLRARTNRIFRGPRSPLTIGTPFIAHYLLFY